VSIPEEAITAAQKSVRAGYGVMAEALAGQIRYALEAAAPIIRGAERDRSEALIVQAQDYATAESERADNLATLARDILASGAGAGPGQLEQWRLILAQLEDAAGEMSPPDSDPLEAAYQSGIKAERDRIVDWLRVAGYDLAADELETPDA
jgi:hypothetical protein